VKRAVLIAGALAALAVVVRWAARPLPPTGMSGPPASPHGPESPGGLAEGASKLKILDEILRSKNDNDPRLDTEFKSLTPETKRLFRKRYAETPPERRNARGTIVYLLGGGNLATDEDWAFLRAVAAEPPCLSLSDCGKKPAPGGDEEAEGDEVTLAYPSLVALKQAQHALESAGAISTASPARSEALSVLAAGTKSSSRAVTRLAARLEKRFSRP
jgi:hypothetical protein